MGSVIATVDHLNSSASASKDWRLSSLPSLEGIIDKVQNRALRDGALVTLVQVPHLAEQCRTYPFTICEKIPAHLAGSAGISCDAETIGFRCRVKKQSLLRGSCADGRMTLVKGLRV